MFLENDRITHKIRVRCESRYFKVVQASSLGEPHERFEWIETSNNVVQHYANCTCN